MHVSLRVDSLVSLANQIGFQKRRPNTYIQTYTHTYILTYLHTYTYVHIYIYICVCGDPVWCVCVGGCVFVCVWCVCVCVFEFPFCFRLKTQRRVPDRYAYIYR